MTPVPAKARRSPVQERSQETVQRILQAASRLLERIPIEELTTHRIAAEAGLSVGALYRFFPAKQAILDAIAVACVEQFRASFEGRAGETNFTDGPAFLGSVIDAYISFLDAHPDFRTIAFGRHISSATRQSQTSPDAPGAAIVKNYLVEMSGITGVQALDLQLRVVIEAGERLIAYAYERPADERPAIVAELKRMLSSYLFG